MEKEQFRVMYASVDGAGYYNERFDTLTEAVEFAKQRAAQSNAGGNPYGYRYYVTYGGRFYFDSADAEGR